VVQVNNIGKEPAKDVVYAIKPILGPYMKDSPVTADWSGLTDPCAGWRPDSGPGVVIFPGTQYGIPKPLNLSPAEVTAITGQKRSLTVEGCFRYRTFGILRFSAFRFFLRDVPGPSCAPDEKGKMQCAWKFNDIPSGRAD